jgi:hypothetical protein
MKLVLSDAFPTVTTMSQDPHAQFDEAVMDMIERSPTGAVPTTPAYQDSLKRLYAAHKIYASADHKDGHVTARSLAGLPSFHAENLSVLRTGAIAAAELEANNRIFDRYVRSLPEERRKKAETYRLLVAGRPAHHRKHGAAEAIHDPIHTLILVPGTGPHHGLPGNYLYGSILQMTTAENAPWAIHLHDSDDGVAVFDAATMLDALDKLTEVIESAPFTMDEITALDFRLL